MIVSTLGAQAPTSILTSRPGTGLSSLGRENRPGPLWEVHGGVEPGLAGPPGWPALAPGFNKLREGFSKAA